MHGANFRYLPARVSGSRCHCGPPTDAMTIHRASGRAGESAVCDHDVAWRLIDPGAGDMFLRWEQLRGRDAMTVRRKLAHAPATPRDDE